MSTSFVLDDKPSCTDADENYKKQRVEIDWRVPENVTLTDLVVGLVAAVFLLGVVSALRSRTINSRLSGSALLKKHAKGVFNDWLDRLHILGDLRRFMQTFRENIPDLGMI